MKNLVVNPAMLMSSESLRASGAKEGDVLIIDDHIDRMRAELIEKSHLLNRLEKEAGISNNNIHVIKNTEIQRSHLEIASIVGAATAMASTDTDIYVMRAIPQSHPPTNTPEYHASRVEKAQAKRDRKAAAKLTQQNK